jgi:hypothetical protein
MKKVYYSLLILFIVLISISPVILAEPNTDLNVLLYSEDKEDTATHLKLYASDEIIPNKSIIYSIVITASVPSPLGSGNVIDQGLVALVVPETAEVDYKNIKVYGAPTPDSNKYVEYQPKSESIKAWFDILGSIVSKIPFLGLVMDLAPIYQARSGDYEKLIDLNQYDIVKVNWEVPRLKYWQKVQIDIPVHLSNDTGIGLYAYWQSRASSSDGTGPTYARDNMVDIGFNISKETLKTTYTLRDTGPAGGLIFYDKGSYSDGWRYLEAAPVSTEWTRKEWGSYGFFIGGTKTGIGTGQNNTTIIVTWLNSHGETDKAAQLCDALVYSGYTDWFLPSKDELNMIYKNLYLKRFGAFTVYYYLSSSEYNTFSSAWVQGFGNGSQSSLNKYNSKYGRVRAVRSF